jgi:ubiquinone/menaquinone biosynthesis C-methylase UbiE
MEGTKTEPKCDSDFITAERQRLLREYERRETAIGADRYAPWQPAEILLRDERKRLAAAMLQRVHAFPQAGDQCLEIGYGALGWLGELISWGVREVDLHGIELNARRAQQAQERLPRADLRIGDAAALPWEDETFHLVIVSTVFSSILDAQVRHIIAREITRVVRPGGALLWYDLAVNNPRNHHVRGIKKDELRRLFPRFRGEIKRVSLAAPLARLIAPRSWTLATALGAIPLLRTHLLAVLIKPR